MRNYSYLKEPIIAGKRLSEFDAKMQSYPEISSCAVDTSVFQGANRSSLLLLHNRRGLRQMRCVIDFIGEDNARRTERQSAFEALFLGAEPVQIDIGDGFFYNAVLNDISPPKTEGELITTVEYEFYVTRHKQEITALAQGENYKLYCISNVRRTDCIIRLPYIGMGEAHDIEVKLNGLNWIYAPTLTDDLILDGVHKIFLHGSTNVTSDILWTDFPYLVPGENSLSLFINGVVLFGKFFQVTYTPTFL